MKVFEAFEQSSMVRHSFGVYSTREKAMAALPSNNMDGFYTAGIDEIIIDETPLQRRERLERERELSELGRLLAKYPEAVAASDSGESRDA